jgi:hypothetical protein
MLTQLRGLKDLEFSQCAPPLSVPQCVLFCIPAPTQILARSKSNPCPRSCCHARTRAKYGAAQCACVRAVHHTYCLNSSQGYVHVDSGAGPEGR